MGIKEKALKAAKWTSITTIIGQIIVFFFSIIKYRLLDVEVFGIMAIVNSIITILRMVQTMGFGPAIVQKETISPIFVNSVFWLIICISILFSSCLILLSGWISNFYNLEILKIILPITAAQFVFNSFIIVQQTLLARELDFKVIRLIGLVSMIGSSLITIYLALNNYGIWSLVFGSIASSLITFVFYLKYTKWFPSFEFSWDALKSSAKFGFNITLHKTVSILKLSAPELIVGKILGTEALGLYSFAKGIILRIVKQADAMIIEVLFPLFSRLQNEKTILVKGYLKANHYTFLLTIPILLGYIYIAKDFVEVLYGQKWLTAVTISQILLIFTLINSVYGKGTSIITAVGRPDISVKIELFMFIPLVTGLLIAVHFGIIHFVITLVSIKSIEFIIQQMVLRKIVNLKFIEFLRCLKTPTMASIVMITLLFILQFMLPQTIDPRVSLITIILSCGITYFLTLFYLDKQELIPTIKSLIKSK